MNLEADHRKVTGCIGQQLVRPGMDVISERRGPLSVMLYLWYKDLRPLSVPEYEWMNEMKNYYINAWGRQIKRKPGRSHIMAWFTIPCNRPSSMMEVKLENPAERLPDQRPKQHSSRRCGDCGFSTEEKEPAYGSIGDGMGRLWVGKCRIWCLILIRGWKHV